MLQKVFRRGVPSSFRFFTIPSSSRLFSTAVVTRTTDEEVRPPSRHVLHPSLAHPTVTKWQQEAQISSNDLVYPLFVTDQDGAKEEIKSLPGQYRWGVDRLDEVVGPLVANGLSSVLLFGVISNKARKDGRGTFADDDTSPVMRALPKLLSKYPSLYLMCDVCLCGYTDHGHCGILHHDGKIDNLPSIVRLGEIAGAYAEAGAHCVAPSDMMDGRVHSIKQQLKKKGKEGQVAVMSYSAKFASCYYGPFREAASSSMAFGDRTKYQLPPMARQLALRAMERDVAEGADMIMVKPGGPYLDIVREAKNKYNLPIAIYQVSGEYAMLYHAAQAGAFPLKDGVMESIIGARRAGADIVISYFTPQLLEWLNKPSSSSPSSSPSSPSPQSSNSQTETQKK